MTYPADHYLELENRVAALHTEADSPLRTAQEACLRMLRSTRALMATRDQRDAEIDALLREETARNDRIRNRRGPAWPIEVTPCSATRSPDGRLRGTNWA